MGQLEDGSIPPRYEQLNLSFINNLDQFFKNKVYKYHRDTKHSEYYKSESYSKTKLSVEELQSTPVKLNGFQHSLHQPVSGLFKYYVFHKTLKMAAPLPNCTAVEQKAKKRCLCSEGNVGRNFAKL